MRVCHIITGLGKGGAESTLFKVLRCSTKESIISCVISLSREAYYLEPIENLGIRVHLCDLRGNSFAQKIKNTMHAFRIINRFGPDLIQTWMYHADLFGSLYWLRHRNTPLVWNLRHSTMRWLKTKPATIFIRQILRLLSKFAPRRIICCGVSVKESHKLVGYAPDKLHIIQNGFDFAAFAYSESARNTFRQRYGINSNEFILANIGRWSPQKNQKMFLQIIARLKEGGFPIRALLAGHNCDASNLALVKILEELNIRNITTTLGMVNNTQEFYSAADAVISVSQYGEGFPNIIAEAKINNCPVIATDIGDTSMILGRSDFLVQTSSFEGLQNACESLLANLRGRDLCRKGMMSNSTIISDSEMFQKYLKCWKEII